MSTGGACEIAVLQQEAEQTAKADLLDRPFPFALLQGTSVRNQSLIARPRAPAVQESRHLQRTALACAQNTDALVNFAKQAAVCWMTGFERHLIAVA